MCNFIPTAPTLALSLAVSKPGLDCLQFAHQIGGDSASRFQRLGTFNRLGSGPEIIIVIIISINFIHEDSHNEIPSSR